VPGECSTVDQSPISFFVYQVNSSNDPVLKEVVHEGNLGYQKLTSAVPTASMAESKLQPWVGLFTWQGLTTKTPSSRAVSGLSLSGNVLTIYGKTVPRNASSPLPYASGKGLVTTQYVFRWDSNVFRFVKSTAGFTPISLYP